MIRIALVSPMLNTMGGGAKDLALIFKFLDRAVFDPVVVSSYIHPGWPEIYGIDTLKCFQVDIRNSRDILKFVLQDVDVVVLWVGTANEPSEYETVWEATAKGSLRVMRIVFGLGVATPDKADLFLTSSMDSFLVGNPCRGCHVVYPPLPTREKQAEGKALRAAHGIPETAFVVGYACSDHRSEFFTLAQKMEGRGWDGIFLSALDRLNDQQQRDYPAAPKNMKFCGIIPQPRMQSLYEASDVLVHTRTESFGYAVYQGMAVGIPVIALWTDSRNAFAEAMYPDGGYIARDVDGLIDALISVREHPVQANDRGSLANLRSLRLNPLASVRRIEQLVLRALEERGACPTEFRGFDPKPDSYVTEQDVEFWRIRKAEIEQKLKVQSFI